jgi:class 3 adenylate cyclase
MTTPFEPQHYPEERRLATVLFADVQGFTTLADQMDFEDVGDLMREVWVLVDQAIESHGGYIDKHIGDAVMAVWGAPHASEDDAERAVSAALTLQQLLHNFSANSELEGANQLRMRVGINTGPVLAGYVGARGEYTVLGDTVNIASRLETTAEPGTIVVGDSTYRLVRGMFRMKVLPPMVLKGKHQPIGAYLVEGKLDTSSLIRYRNRGGLETNMVGREPEMDQLRTLLIDSLKTKSIKLAVVRGDAGIGKSRLLMEFASLLDVQGKNFQLLTVRCLAQASRVPYYAWRVLWHGRFGLLENDKPDVAREKFVRGVQSLFARQLGPVSAIEIAHVVGALTGIDFPDSSYLSTLRATPNAFVDRAFELTRELLKRIASFGPVVLEFDDLHWADGGSLDLIEFLVETPGEAQLLIVGATRPGLLRTRRFLRSVAAMISLKPLELTPELVATAYPAMAAMPQPMLAEIARTSEGNPYYMEEMVKNLMSTTAQGLTAEPSETDVKLPESLHATLQARLDALSSEARTVALLASVVGRVFWVGAIMAASQSTSGTGLLRAPGQAGYHESFVLQGLHELVKAELAFPRAGSMFEGEQEYIFKHSLLRDVAYSLIPHKHRRQYHLSVARWLARFATPDFASTIAEHFELAGAITEAALQFEAAAEHARACGATGEAQWLAQHAHELRTMPPPGTRQLGQTGPLPNLS